MEPVRHGEQHPLENVNILEEIFQNCTLEELKECRQVCKVWINGSTKALRESSTVTVDCRENEDKLTEFIDFLEELNNRFLVVAPFNFSLYLNNSEINPRFWTLCGAHIKHLSLCEGYFRSAQDFQEAIFGRCPNLEFLFLSDFNVRGDHVPEPMEWQPPRYQPNSNMKVLRLASGIFDFTVPFFEIFIQFPRLENLNIQGVVANCKEVINSLGIVRRHTQDHCKLHTLKFYFNQIDDLDGMMDILVDGHLEFKKLNLGGIINTERVTALWKLLRGHSTSLKELSVMGDTSPNPQMPAYSLQVPDDLVLENVTIFKLVGNIFLSMEFLKFFPNLKALVLMDVPLHESVQNTSLQTIGNIGLRSCSQLYIDCDEEAMDLDDLERLGVWLPNLQKIHFQRLGSTTEYSNSMFETLCRTWPNLTSVKIVNSILDDFGITGLDVEDVNRINRAGESGAERSITVRRANITSLKNLQRFSIKTVNPLADPSH